MTTLSGARQPLVLPPIKQESASHCGPATLQLLYSHLKRSFTQAQIVKAAGVADKIAEFGMRPHQLAKAVAVLTPELEFWFKPKATREDLHQLLCVERWPAAVNWQGLFYASPELEPKKPRDDRGHYSVVIDLDLDLDRIVIADPYFEFSAAPRVFSLKWFKARWWDSAQDANPATGVEERLRTKHLLFVIAPKDATFPKRLGMLPPSELGRLKSVKKK